MSFSAIRIAIVFGFLFLCGSTFAQSVPAPSLWKNQRGSELSIWTSSGGAFKGLFTNHASGFECQGIPYPVTGRETSRGLFFVVTFTQCNSFTRWYGRVNGSKMPTTWTLYYTAPNGSVKTLSGTDVFTRAF